MTAPNATSARANTAMHVSPAKPTFTVRVDEAAVAIHEVFAVRALLTLGGAATAMLILPRITCAIWLCGGLGLEVWSWFATRRQARGVGVSRAGRANFAANYLATNLWWLLLALLFFNAGSVEGRASGTVLFVAMGALFALLIYTHPVVFLATGAALAIGAASVILLDDGLGWREMLPVAMALGLSMVFCLGRALDTPSVQESKRRVKDSLDQFKVLAENVTDIITRTDLNGVYQYVSPASLAVLGYRPEEMIGMLRRDIMHPDSAEQAAAAGARMWADPSRSEVITSQARRKDGSWIWLQLSIKLVCENGRPVGVISVSRDVTERMAADIALNEAKLEAEAANLAKAEFLANVSHEIRTPMNGILGALHLLEREPISPEGRELMRQADDAGRMLSQLLNDVLDFSKIEAGQLDLTPEPMDVGEALEGVVALLDAQARAKGIALTCAIEGADRWIEADPVRVRQAMFNLLGNAVKFTPQGRVSARLTVSPAPDGRRRVRLEVEDTGIGMTPQAQAHLFERFRQADGAAARRFGGTGLGLSITRAVVRMMGGEIGFSSAEGQGSTFTLDFEAPAAGSPVRETADGGLLEGVSILLVEDNATNRLVARTMLSRLGATVDEAEDGLAGLAAARAGAYDLILMDIQMPRMDGVDATRAIRTLGGAAGQVPIIGLTANAMTHQRAKYLAAGMNGVVAKPISPAALLGEIARVVGAGEVALAG